jgi:uncharacterized membrane protein YoaK (UPF0700 family)
VVGPVVALVAFMAGALLAGRTLRSVPAAWTGRTTALLGLVVALLVASAVVDLVLDDPARLVLLALTAALGAAMGLQAQAARHLAVKDVTTVVVTSTLTGLSADSWFGGRTGQPWARRAGAVALICAGAATGALLLGAGIAAGHRAVGGAHPAGGRARTPPPRQGGMMRATPGARVAPRAALRVALRVTPGAGGRSGGTT